MKNPQRINSWLRPEDVWLHQCLDDLAVQMTKAGIKSTKSDMVRLALLEVYGNQKQKYVPSKDIRVEEGSMVNRQFDENCPEKTGDGIPVQF